MNIVFFCKYYYPHIGGVEKHVREVAERLVKKSHQITVVCLKHNSKLPDIQTMNGVKILRLPYLENKFLLWKNLWQKKELIKKADIIHCHDVFFWYWPFKLTYPLKKVFITFHGWEGEYPTPYKYKLVRKINELLANGNICIGDYLTKHYGTKTTHISYGAIDNLISDRALKCPQANQIVFIGRLEKDLGLDEYLKAIKKLKKDFNLKVTFIGDGSYRKKCQELGTVTGMLKDITKYLKKPCLVFASSYLTILEAMAHKRPVFALYQNQLKKDYLKYFPGARFIWISGSHQELFNQAKNYLQGWTLKVKKAYKFAQTQTWNKVVGLYLKLWYEN